MTNYKLSISNRKDLVKRLEELTDTKARYTFVPRCAYECGPYTVERNGDLTVEDGADMSIIQTLLDEGLVMGSIEAEEAVEETMGDEMAETETAEAEETTESAEEPTEGIEPTEEMEAANSLTISLPMARHSIDSLRRLVNLIYSRGPLLSKSTGGTFGADKELLKALDEADIVKMEDFISMVTERGGLTGLTFEDGKINFTGFPMTEDPERTQAFMQLASLMNRHAIEMKRIQAKEVNDENEKYAFRIWLLRIGMNSDEYKSTRKVLMENLSGHTAFRTRAEEEKWKTRQKAKRDELRAAKAAALASEQESEDNETEEEAEA